MAQTHAPGQAVVVVVVLVVVVVVLVVVEVVVLVVPRTHSEARHSPVCVPGTGGAAQGQSAGQELPVATHWAPSHFHRHTLPHPGVVLVVG